MDTGDSAASVETIESADGTAIACERRGDGDPLVLVHGTMAARDAWNPIEPELRAGRTIVSFDRRGRGESGDAGEHSLDLEVADLRAVLESIDGDPDVFGHSFGGLCALEAARRTSVGRLILYEPTAFTDADRRNADLADRMEASLAEGNREEAVETFLRELGDVGAVDPLPFWPECTRFAETIVRESRAVEGYEIDDEIEVSAPTLLLRGEASPSRLRDGTAALSEALTRDTLVELRGVGHDGISTAPTEVAREVNAFLDAH